MNEVVSFPIVLVQLGPIPKYLKSNLQYLDNTFPKIRKILISDAKKDASLSGLSFEWVNPKSLISHWPAQFQISDNRRFFRGNFWFTSKARLLLIPELMKVEHLERILHLENDVWMHPQFPFEFFDKLKAPLAFPKVDSERGIASTLFINGQEGMRILQKACIQWSTSSDMQILGNIFKSNPNVLELPSTYSFDCIVPSNWLFDGAKLGMFLFGSDPRNTKGIIRRFARSPMGNLDKNQKLYFDGKNVVLRTEEKDFFVATLHLHSKYINMFNENWNLRLRRQLRREQWGLNYSFSWTAFWKSLMEIKERLFRKLKTFM